MTALVWDEIGKRLYETGVEQGVLYPMKSNGEYDIGVAWNGLTNVTESPEGADANPQYADNKKYLNLISAEDFKGTIEAFTYPDEFEECDGSKEIAPGVTIGQQNRKLFGFAYKTAIGNDTDGTDHGYKIHLIYGAMAAPSERAHETINDSPSPLTFSWSISTTPINVPGFKPTAHLVIDSTKVSAEILKKIEDTLFGTDGVEGDETKPGTDPTLMLPKEILDLFEELDPKVES